MVKSSNFRLYRAPPSLVCVPGGTSSLTRCGREYRISICILEALYNLWIGSIEFASHLEAQVKQACIEHIFDCVSILRSYPSPGTTIFGLHSQLRIIIQQCRTRLSSSSKNWLFSDTEEEKPLLKVDLLLNFKNNVLPSKYRHFRKMSSESRFCSDVSRSSDHSLYTTIRKVLSTHYYFEMKSKTQGTYPKSYTSFTSLPQSLRGLRYGVVPRNDGVEMPAVQKHTKETFSALAEKGKAGTRHQTLGFSARNGDLTLINPPLPQVTRGNHNCTSNPAHLHPAIKIPSIDP